MKEKLKELRNDFYLLGIYLNQVNEEENSCNEGSLNINIVHDFLASINYDIQQLESEVK